MPEVVEEGDDMSSAGMGVVGGDNALEELDLVEGCLCIAGRGLDDLECNVAIEPVVPGEPDRGEVAPSELAYDCIAAIGESVPDVDGMVATLDIVFPVLLVFGHEGMRGRVVIGLVRHWRCLYMYMYCIVVMLIFLACP